MIVGEFLQWMETAPPGKKAEAVRSLARSYLEPGVGDETRSAIESALTVVLDDPDPEVRVAIADVLGASAKAPRHVIIALAADRPDIAALVLARSPVFIDVELAGIASTAESALQVAIASRSRLSKTVAAAVAEVGEEAACQALLANSGAEIARISFLRMAERFGGESDVREALIARRDLPPDVRQLLVRAIGNALGNLAMVKQWLPEARVKTVTGDACDRATVAIAAESATHELPALVEHLRATEQLTTALLLRAVCAGNVAFFETALAMLAEVPVERVARLVRAGRLPALRAAYARAGLPPMAFDAFAAALDVWRRLASDGGPADRYRLTMHTVEAVLTRYADITDGEANELAAMLRRFAADQARDAAREAARGYSRGGEAPTEAAEADEADEAAVAA
jgi:uncharacterized protein (DUF2336 family)